MQLGDIAPSDDRSFNGMSCLILNLIVILVCWKKVKFGLTKLMWWVVVDGLAWSSVLMGVAGGWRGGVCGTSVWWFELF